jgi:hypothetical protein
LTDLGIAEASLRLAQDDPTAAAAVLAPVIDGSVVMPNAHLWDVQAFLLQAIACDTLGDTSAARRALEYALDRAAPEDLLFPSPASPTRAGSCSSIFLSPAARAQPGPASWSSWPAAPEHVRDLLAPVFGALGRATAWLGPVGHGTRTPAEIVDLLQSTPLGAPYAVQKARSMLAGDFSPPFAL